MPTRKQAFRETVQQLEDDFRIRFSGNLTASTQSIIDRVRRSLSWLRRAAELSDEDRPPRFVDLWIALNALYGQPRYAKEFISRDSEDFGEFVQRLAELHSGSTQLGQLISKKHFQARAQELVQNKYLWNEWWGKKLDKYREKSGIGLIQFAKSLKMVMRLPSSLVSLKDSRFFAIKLFTEAPPPQHEKTGMHYTRLSCFLKKSSQNSSG